MNEPSELKRLAEALIAANNLFNESPQDKEVGDAWSLANDRFTEAASPEYILALIAENDHLSMCARTWEEAAMQWAGQRDKLKAFAIEMINASFEGGSFDGGDIQDIGVKHGLLRIEKREDECGERCVCREYGFPAECYRKTPILGAVTDEVATPSSETEKVSRHERR